MAAAAGALLATLWVVVRWRPSRVEVRGDSMAPALVARDWALAVAVVEPARGDVVVLAHPARPELEMVKRIVAVPGDLRPDGQVLGPDQYWVEGDNPSRSTDSRQLGPVRREHLKARIRVVYWPPARRRVVRRREPA